MNGKDFNYSLALGDLGEQKFVEMMARRSCTSKKLHHVQDFLGKNYEYDYDVWNSEGGKSTFEVKCLAGASEGGARYHTAVIEAWANDDKTRRPGWMRAVEADVLKYVVFFNRHDEAFYSFNAKTLYAFVKAEQYLTNTRTNRDCSGWICKVRWNDKEAGFLGKSSAAQTDRISSNSVMA
jgi:hypothetical protein|tara:strand:+ start:5849 stop:6388 length:540 start_codon:yes stop_codon:yes gene_type:complete